MSIRFTKPSPTQPIVKEDSKQQQKNSNNISKHLKVMEHKQANLTKPAYNEDILLAANFLIDVLKHVQCIHHPQTSGLSSDNIAILEAFFDTPEAKARLNGIVRAILIPRMHYIKPLLYKAIELVNNEEKHATQTNPILFSNLKSQILWLNEIFASSSTLEEHHKELLTPLPPFLHDTYYNQS